MKKCDCGRCGYHNITGLPLIPATPQPHTSSAECPNRVDGYCKCSPCDFNRCGCHTITGLPIIPGTPQPATTSTLNGKWPSDTWFQRARSRALKAESERLDIENAKMREVQ